MLTVLLVPDGAADPLGTGPTCLEQAVTSTLDRLAAGGRLQRVATIPAGLPAGSEVGLPALLDAGLSAPPSRGRLEAAAAGVQLEADQAAWRLDLVPARSPSESEVARLDAALAPLGARVRHLHGHRLLLVGPGCWGDGPPGPHQTDRPLREVTAGVFAAIAEAAASALEGAGLAWPWGSAGGQTWRDLPRRLGRPVLVVTEGGAAAGVARLLGCQVVAGAPADGPAVAAEAPADALVVVHDPRPDDAGHARDAAAKIAALETFDAEVVAPAVDVLARRGGQLTVCPDHGCDPATGRHTGEPVPALVWTPQMAPVRPHPAGHTPRLTERAVAALPARRAGTQGLAPPTVVPETHLVGSQSEPPWGVGGAGAAVVAETHLVGSESEPPWGVGGAGAAGPRRLAGGGGLR